MREEKGGRGNMDNQGTNQQEQDILRGYICGILCRHGGRGRTKTRQGRVFAENKKKKKVGVWGARARKAEDLYESNSLQRLALCLGGQKDQRERKQNHR